MTAHQERFSRTSSRFPHGSATKNRRVPGESAVEFAGGGLASFRSGDLDVIEMYDSKLHTHQRIPARN